MLQAGVISEGVRCTGLLALHCAVLVCTVLHCPGLVLPHTAEAAQGNHRLHARSTLSSRADSCRIVAGQLATCADRVRTASCHQPDGKGTQAAHADQFPHRSSPQRSPGWALGPCPCCAWHAPASQQHASATCILLCSWPTLHRATLPRPTIDAWCGPFSWHVCTASTRRCLSVRTLGMWRPP